MLTFFRRTRQGSLDSGQARKYLLYAVGEIALVVIGILIALQINNWNEDRKDAKKEIALLQALRTDFNQSKSRIKRTIESQETVLYHNQVLINHLLHNDRTIMIDSMLTLVYWANVWNRPELVLSSYDAIVSSNEINLIQNEELKRHLARFSADLQNGFEDQAQSDDAIGRMEGHITEISPYLMAPIWQKRLEVSIPPDLARASVSELFKNDAYLGALWYKTKLQFIRQNYHKRLFSDIESILTIIDSELASKK